MQDMKMKDQVASHENAGRENAGMKMQDMKMHDMKMQDRCNTTQHTGLTLDLSPSTCCQSTSGSTVSPFRAILY